MESEDLEGGQDFPSCAVPSPPVPEPSCVTTTAAATAAAAAVAAAVATATVAAATTAATDNYPHSLFFCERLPLPRAQWLGDHG